MGHVMDLADEFMVLLISVGLSFTLDYFLFVCVTVCWVFFPH